MDLYPKINYQHNKEGIMEIEDFGNKTLLNYVKRSKNKLNLYKKCVDVILKLQKIKPVRKIKFGSNKYLNLNSYNTKNLHKESNLFFDWYLYGVLGKKKSSKYKKIIKKELNKLYKKIFLKINLLFIETFMYLILCQPIKNLGVIDTQDAILGNPMYDLASLIDDVRVKVPQIKNKTFQYYLKNCSIKKKQILY